MQPIAHLLRSTTTGAFTARRGSRAAIAVLAAAKPCSAIAAAQRRGMHATLPTTSSRPASPTSNEQTAKHSHKRRSKVTIQELHAMHRRKEPITMLTAHDYPSALFVERSGADTLLVGDSLAMVALGMPTTVEITMDEMLHHCRAVARGASTPFLIADMPFGSYESDSVLAVRNAQRFIKEAGMEAVKLEGGVDMADTVKAVVRSGIPVLGHIGLTPQRLAMLGGFRVQGKSAASAKVLIDDALALQRAGCFAVVLEAVPAPVAEHITKTLTIPTIGIGAGAECSGQVLVQQDMLGIFDRFMPKFCKQYATLSDTITEAMKQYCAEVKSGAFPAPEHTYPMPADELVKFKAMVDAETKKASGNL